VILLEGLDFMHLLLASSMQRFALVA